MKRTGPPCSICAHPKRAGIDADHRAIVRVAKAFQIAPSTLQRHRQHAADAETGRLAAEFGKKAAALAASLKPSGPVEPREVATEALNALRWSLAGAAKEDVPTIANAMARTAKLLAELSGQLVITQSQIIRSQPWRKLMTLLDGVLERHPAAAKEWLEAISQAEGDG